MIKKAIIKTILICTGIFLLLAAGTMYMLFYNGVLEIGEPELQVIVASTNIQKGDEITAGMVEIKTIKQSAINENMIMSTSEVYGKKAVNDIKKGDYIRKHELIEIKYTDEQRITVIEADINARLANLIKRGSKIDIRVYIEDKGFPLVLSGIEVEDILDETGSADPEMLGSKKAYIKLILNREQMDILYALKKYADETGEKLIIELYADETQPVPDSQLTLEELYDLLESLKGE